MTTCPDCGYENIPGAEECEGCQQSLSQLFRTTPSDGIERSIIKDRIEKLPPRAAVIVDAESRVDEVLRTMVEQRSGCALVTAGGGPVGHFPGGGAAGAAVPRSTPKRPAAEHLPRRFRAEYEDTTWGDNLVLLDHYSQDFPERMAKINRTAERITDWLAARPDVATVYYPKHQQRELYDAFKRPDGGYSGLFSVLLRNAATRTEPFYNALQICKGPNLGTTFSLCCPFTLLAHYDELEWAERCGVSRYLLRFSIGLEEPDDLIARLEHAFRKSEAG